MIPKKIIVVFLCCLSIAGTCLCQDSSTVKILTADSLAGGNYKDIFVSFLQLAASDLTGPNKELKFNSNPYAIMLKHDQGLAAYPSYKKYTYLRNMNFSLGAKLDSSYHFNGLSFGVTYALVNNRDYTIKKQFLAEALRDQKTVTWFDFNNAVSAELSTINDLPTRKKYRDDYEKLFSDSTSKFSDLDSEFQRLVSKVCDDSKFAGIKKLIADPNFNIYKIKNQSYNDLKKIYENRALWTLGVSDTSYSDGNLFKNLKIVTEYTKGLLSPTGAVNLQLDLMASVNFTDDTLIASKNISRQVLSLEPGINFVLSGSKSHKSYLEFKVSGSYNDILKGQYSKENQVMNTINGTLRILILDNIWIPIQIKYDTKTHNLFGFLNVTTNFTGLGSLFKNNGSNK